MPPPLCLRPSRPPPPGRRFPPASAGPHPIPVSFLTAPVPRPPTPSLALTSSPLLLSIRAPLRPLHPPSLSLYLSLSLLTERFHRRRFFSGLVAVCRLSLYRILSSTGTPYEARARARSARCSPLSPGERINDECFTLSPEVGPFAFARARARASGLFCHYPLCFLHILCAPRILFSLFPRFYSSEPVFPPAISLPCVPSDPT